MTENRTLNVIYHDRVVGLLAEMPDRRIAFQYDKEWLGNGFSISPRSLPLTHDVFIPQESSREKFGGLFGVFADSLPDSWGSLLLDRYLATLGINHDDISTLDKLAYIGRSGMGALEYAPSKEADYDVISAGLPYDTIAMECEKLLSSRPSDHLDTLYRLGASGGGTRPKIMLSENGREWIVKFPAGKDPAVSGKWEYAYSLCAKNCGITMTETELIPSAICEGYFKTERFDRKDGKKIFGITFAGLLEADFRAPSCDYETFFRLVRSLTRDNLNDAEQLFRIMCFNVLAHNRDDHTKNFTFQYTNEQGWHLSPGYDLTYSDTYWGEHTTSVGGKGKNITDEDLIAIGTKDAGLSKKRCAIIIEEIRQETSKLDVYLQPSSAGKSRHISFSESIAELMQH